MNLDEFKVNLAKELTPRERMVCDVAGSHHYRCTCDICLEWWAGTGPDGGEPGHYGPFTKEQVNAKQKELGFEITP